MASLAQKKSISLSDVITLDFWRYFTKALFLFFPAVFFLVFAWLVFWTLGPAKDVMVISLEHQYVFGYCLIALIFWTYVTWYSSRLVAKAKQFKHPDENHIWVTFLVQFPRLLGFTCFTIIILAYLQLPYLSRLSGTVVTILFLSSFLIYFFLIFLSNRIHLKLEKEEAKKIKFLAKLRTTVYLFLFAITVAVILLQKFYGLIIMLFCWQVGIVIILLIRRELIDVRKDAFEDSPTLTSKKISLVQQAKLLLFDKEDRVYFRTFNIIALIAAIIYLATIISVSFSVKVGSFPFVLLAFGVILGYINFIAFVSVIARFNVHVILITIALITCNISEPHYAPLIDREHPQISYKKRQHLAEYFSNWIDEPSRKEILGNDSVKEYPVYFVLANGGGARSAYWVASVLSKFEDSTQGQFSKHLLCLSGASGGTWGNAVFFNLLFRKNVSIKTNGNFQPVAKKYLKNDFLTYTLARMLGPDIFRYIFPLGYVRDRDAALAHAMETVPGKHNQMYNDLATGFSSLITQQGQSGYTLPLFCINTTRMQDASPGVISNIDLSDAYFNGRLEVLNMIDNKKDLKLSTAVVFGGSSPYINSAQRIDEKTIDSATGKEKIIPQYFVDGGYFDNSGAGVVNEMIIELLRELNADSSLSDYKEKISFYVLNITNDPVDKTDVGAVSPLINDLLSPIKTLAGSYGSQTTINDFRLKNYMHAKYGNDQHYQTLDLYRSKDPMSYPVSWVISGHVIDSIDNRIAGYEKIPSLLQKMKDAFNAQK
ncbi:MAG: hypothetical protein ABI683_06545 [Ginsengibacter sp.]